MAWFEHGNARVYFEEEGAGEPLLLLPGWSGSIEEMAALRAALRKDFRVISADLPGSGKSGPQPRTYDADYWRRDAGVFLALLKSQNALPAHLLGFSDGGEYCLLMAALEAASVRSLVTWGAAGSLGNNLPMADAMATAVDAPIPPMAEFSEYLKQYYGEDNARVMTRSLGAVLRTVMESGGDISLSLAGNIACPAFLITGQHDFLATPAMVREMASAIPGGEYAEAEGASHAVHVEKGDWLVAAVTGWLGSRLALS